MRRAGRHCFSSVKIFRRSARLKRAARQTPCLLSLIRVRVVPMCPVGGAGLLCGTAVAAKSMRPNIKVIAVEPEKVDDAAQSFRAGKRIVTKKKFTIADGLRTNIGEPNFAIIQRYVDGIVTVSEDAIISAMRTIWETM